VELRGGDLSCYLNNVQSVGLWNVRMIISLPTKRKLISVISQWKTFIRVLPTGWQQKPAGIEITSVSPYVYWKFKRQPNVSSSENLEGCSFQGLRYVTTFSSSFHLLISMTTNQLLHVIQLHSPTTVYSIHQTQATCYTEMKKTITSV